MQNIDKILLGINRDVTLLAPFVQKKLRAALDACHEHYLDVAVFEGWRSPLRQNELYAQGREIKGKIVTQARAWHSFHQLGLAIDLAFQNGNKWRWDGDWDDVRRIFMAQGFESLAPQEQAHFQITGGLTIGDAVKINSLYGLPALWAKIGSSL